MTQGSEAKENKQQNTNEPPAIQQFAAGGSAVPTPELPYDVEKVHRGAPKAADEKNASKPSK